MAILIVKKLQTKRESNIYVDIRGFDSNNLILFRDTQFAAFYDQNKYVVLGKRKLEKSEW